MKPIKHHPLVTEALNQGVPGSIPCSSKEEMESVFNQIASHYGNKVVQGHLQPYTAILWPIGPKRSRMAREAGITHHVIKVSTWERWTSAGEKFSVTLKTTTCAKESARWHKECITTA